MNAYLELASSELWHIAGWTMLHFLWLGTALGVAAAVCRLVLRRAPAQVRYVVAIGWLALVAASPIAVTAWLAAKPQAVGVRQAVGETVAATLREANFDVALETTPSALGSAGGSAAVNRDTNRAATPRTAPNQTATNQIATTAPTSVPRQSRGLTSVFDRPTLLKSLAAMESAARYLPWLWIIGTPLTFALLATGVVGAERLRQTSRPVADGPIIEACARLRNTMRITRQVSVAVCERIAAPVLVGIVRPIILLPPAALTGWSPDEIEMVLLHELAHVRRWDNLLNLLQRFIESLLFFHPAVWWVSSWVRREREACCDAVVVGRTNRPHAYAEMLVALAAQMPRSVLFHPTASSAMAAGPLRGRIRRILQLEDDPMLVSGKSLALVMGGLLMTATLTVLYLPTVGQAEESATEDTEENAKPVEQQLPTDEIDLSGLKIPPGSRRTVLLDPRLSAEALTRAVRALQEKGYKVRLEGVNEGSILVVINDLHASQFASLDEQIESTESTETNNVDQFREVFHDPEKLKLLFAESDRNPLQTRTYRVPPSLGSNLSLAFEGLRLDPYGPKVKFKSKWNSDQSAFEITAPEDAHEAFFSKFISQVVAAEALEESTTETMVSTKAVRQADTKNNLKNLALALLNYENVHKTLPAHASYAANGRPLLSWRVLILPYLGNGESQALYEEFHLDEPWDSSHNQTLLARMPEVFKNPKLDRPGMTNYLAVVGKLCIFNGSAKGVRLSEITDGTSKTIALVEANADKAVEWTKPADWWFDSKNPTAGLGALWHDHWHGAWVDGSVRAVKNSESADAVSEFFTRADGGVARSGRARSDGLEMGAFGRSRPATAAHTRYRFPSPEDQKFTEVSFVQGATSFGDGDRITIVQVRGTAETFKPGNIYWIKGTYTLRSHDRAMLAAYTTAKDAANGISPSLSVQSTNVDRGEGTFSLFLPMSYRGWPHVSFYADGEGFGGVYFGTGDSVLKQWWASNKALDEEKALDKNGTLATTSTFPSLEDQKLADLVWKRLGLELGPIGDEDRRRVRALGFDSGLRVDAVSNLDGGRRRGQAIETGDILVGLHAWPTTSFQNVVDVLNRVDLPQLNPLKFYVVRRHQLGLGGGFGGGRQGPTEDRVLTGRITVTLGIRSQGASGGASRSFDFVVRPPAPATKPSPPALPSLPRYGDAPPRPADAAKPQAAIPTLAALPVLAVAPGRQGTSTDKSALRYDGKSFGQWRSEWRTELSTEKRLEAVKALAAFGASGYGREAAEAIIEVAGQYNWSSDSGNDAVRSLEGACLNAFGAKRDYLSHELPRDDALFVLLRKVDSTRDSTRLFVAYALNGYTSGNPDALKAVVKLSNDEHGGVRAAAWESLRPAFNPDSKIALDRVHEGLNGTNTFDKDAALQVLIHYCTAGRVSREYYVPEVFPLLFADQESVRPHARFMMQFVPPEDAPQVVEQLLEILNDESRQADHLAAVRVLAAMGPKAAPALDKLGELLSHDDWSLKVAAVVALKRMWRQADEPNPEINKAMFDSLKITFVAGGFQSDGSMGQKESKRLLPAMKSEEDGLFR